MLKSWKSCLIVALALTFILITGSVIAYYAMLPDVDDGQAKGPKIKKTDNDSAERKNSITDIILDHPLEEAENRMDPILMIAKEGLKHIDENVNDYSATIVKRERVDGKLLDEEFISCKIRNPKPDQKFSVYLRFIKPQRLAEQEAIYVDGKYGSKIIGHGGGLLKHAPAVKLDPKGRIAMINNRYPITEIGLRNLVARMVEKAEANREVPGVEVTIDRNIEFNGHSATLIVLKHPEKKQGLEFHLAKVYIDDELNMPVGYAAYLWPEKDGDEPPLLESYFYNDLKTNCGFKDIEFDPANPDYEYSNY